MFVWENVNSILWMQEVMSKNKMDAWGQCTGVSSVFIYDIKIWTFLYLITFSGNTKRLFDNLMQVNSYDIVAIKFKMNDLTR